MSREMPFHLHEGRELLKHVGIYSVRTVRRFFGLAQPQSMRKAFRRMLSNLHREDLLSSYQAKHPELIRENAMAYVSVLDRIAKDRGAVLWLDKSPCHIFCIEHIEKYVDQAKFLHIVRNGADVVASMRDAAQKYGKHSPWARFADLDYCVEYWNAALSVTRKYQSRDNHKVVRYAQLVENPTGVLGDVCQYLEIDCEEGMWTDRAKTASRITGPWQASTWQSNLSEPLSNNTGTKFNELFNEDERAYVLRHLTDVSDISG
jgi:hypothetical protein